MMQWAQVRAKEKNQMPDTKDRLLRAAELLDLAEHLICTLETCDRSTVVQFVQSELQAVQAVVALLNASTWPIGRQWRSRLGVSTGGRDGSGPCQPLKK